MSCLVDDSGGEQRVTFLYKLVPGPCPKSFGINVARLAELPPEVSVSRIANVSRVWLWVGFAFHGEDFDFTQDDISHVDGPQFACSLFVLSTTNFACSTPLGITMTEPMRSSWPLPLGKRLSCR